MINNKPIIGGKFNQEKFFSWITSKNEKFSSCWDKEADDCLDDIDEARRQGITGGFSSINNVNQIPW